MLKKNFNHTNRFWGCDEKFRLMNRKGVYPYEYMDGWEKFEERSLPLKDAFYSRVSMKTMNMRSRFGIPWRKRPQVAITILI